MLMKFLIKANEYNIKKSNHEHDFNYIMSREKRKYIECINDVIFLSECG